MSKTAFITGTTGQIGSYSCELLLEKGYKVVGLKRRSSSHNSERIDHIFHNKNLELIYGDLSDYGSILSIVSDLAPDICLNLGAQSHVLTSFQIPDYTMDITANGVLRVLEAIRHSSPKTKFLTASSSEMFGSTLPPQHETSLFNPCSPYSCAKLAGYNLVRNYRKAYSLFASNAIAFNNESPRRSETFVTRKMTRGATRIKLGLQDKLVLGNTAAKRDWGHSRDTARAMLMILEHDQPDDFVISTGEMHSVQELVEKVFGMLDLDWKEYLEIDLKRYARPSEVDALCGDSTKIRKTLGWLPTYSFDDLIKEMVDSDMKLAQQEKLIKESK